MVPDGAAWSSAAGEMLARIHAHDWAATPLGAMERWPERLRAAVDVCLGSALPTFVWWGPTLVQVYNDAALAILRTKHPQALGRPAREAWSDIWPVVGTLVEQVMATGQPVRGDDLPLHLDRGCGPQEAWFTFWYGALHDVDGRIAGMFISAIETTARVRADRDFRVWFAASPTPFLVVAPDAPRFTISEVNDAYLWATMRRRDQLIGRTLFDAFPDNPADPSANGVRNLQASPERVIASRRLDSMPIQKYDVARPDGAFEERLWSPVNTPILDEAGRVSAIIHHVEDVTDRHRAEQALREADRRKDEFLAMLAHELRNPLAPITNAHRLLDRTEPLSDRGRRALELAQRQTQQLQRLVDDLLEINRITQGKIVIRPEPMSVGAAVHAAVESVAPLFEQRAQRIAVYVPPAPTRCASRRCWRTC